MSVDTLSKPLRLDESTTESLPESLLKILREDLEQNELKADVDWLAVLLHALMLETGFETSLSPPLKNLRKFNYKLSSSNGEEARVTLALTTIGTVLYIHGIFHSTVVEAKSLSMSNLDPRNFVRSELQPLNRKFRNLKTLSREFKNAIALRLIHLCKDELGLPAGPESLNVMPDEVLLHILSFADHRTVLRFGMTCKSAQRISKEQSLWRALFERDFPRIYYPRGDDWLYRYKTEFQRKSLVSAPVLHVFPMTQVFPSRFPYPAPFNLF